MKFRAFPCLLATSLIITSAFLFRVPSVYSQSIGLSISPVILEVMIKPGKTITQAYQVTNNSEQDLYLTANLVPFTPADHQGHIALSASSSVSSDFPRNSVFSLQNSNLDLNQPFKLSAGKSQQLVLKIAMPEDNPEKDYYYTLLVEQTDRGEHITTDSGAGHRIKIGSNILITVSETGQPETDFKIAEFKAEPKFGDIFDQIRFKILVENTGRAFFKPEGKIEIYHTLLNKKITELNLLPENILVNSVREIRCGKKNFAQGKTSEVSKDLTSQVGELGEVEESAEVIQPTPCFFSFWLPGKYKAVVGANRDLSLHNPNTTYFYLIPYRLILGLLITGLIIWQIKRKLGLDNK
jgi:hypothetical protein